MMNRLTLLILCTVISIGSSIVSVTVYHKVFAVKIVAAETSGFLEQARSDFLNKKITQKELEQRIENVFGMIRQQPENTVVLSSDVVLSKNVEIITP